MNTKKEKKGSFGEKINQLEGLFHKNKKIISAVGIGVAVIIVSIVGYKYYLSSQNEQAQREMFQAVYYFEADSLNKALKGDGNNLGFEDIIDDYSATKAGNLARFYVGVIYIKKGQFQDAIDNLKKFSSTDFLIQARAYCLIGDAHLELNQYKEAAEYYHRASSYKPNKFFSPQYMMKEALAYEKEADYQSAIDVYTEIIEKFSYSNVYNNAQKNKARIEALQAEKK